MRKLLIFIFCLGLASCAGTRTLDGETTKNWVKIVSSKIDRSGNIQDVCFVFDLSFYPGTVYERLKNNPNTCLEECCWYSENKSVDFYFNDGFTKDLEEYGVSRRYYPDNIRINLTYSRFLNRLSAKASSSEGISKDGVITLEYKDIYKPDLKNEVGAYEIKEKTYPEALSAAAKEDVDSSYKKLSMSGLNRKELLTKAENEQREYYIKAVEERYESPEKEYVEEIMLFKGQVSPFDKTDKEKKWLSKKPIDQEEKLRQQELLEYRRQVKEERAKAKQQVKDGKEKFKQQEEYFIQGTTGQLEQLEQQEESFVQGTAEQMAQQKENIKQGAKQIKSNAKDAADGAMYDVQRTLAQEAKIVYIEPVMPEEVDADTLARKLEYETNEAVKLLKRFYGDDIDGYLRSLDNAKKQKGQVLFTNDKVWKAQKIGTTVYQVNCNVKGKIASLSTKTTISTTDYPIACGTYVVDLDEKTVEARDNIAKDIALKKY